METVAELPFIGDQVVCLSHDQAARSGPAERAVAARSEPPLRPLRSPARAPPVTQPQYGPGGGAAQ
jgi:hypothetical protein